jgi:uncharacterized protein (TIGR02646 family)
MKKLTPAKIDAAVLKKLHEKSESLQQKSWDYTGGYPRRFKDTLSIHLLKEQSQRCAYCGSRLAKTKNHRDHIAPKESHPRFTFIPQNLVLACYHCNTGCKGRIDTVTVKKEKYEDCEFSIVHPYLDEPSQHLVFVGATNAILIQVVDNSPAGNGTVRLFGLDSPEKTKERAKEAAFEADIAFLGEKWRDGFEVALAANIKMKQAQS